MARWIGANRRRASCSDPGTCGNPLFSRAHAAAAGSAFARMCTSWPDALCSGPWRIFMRFVFTSVFLIGATAAGLVACSGDTDSGGSGGASGGGSGGTTTGGSAGATSGGSAGSATGGSAGSATGGSAGSATGGSAGSATGGSAGSATGGSAGSAGAAAKAECTTAADCKPFEDCCTCSAVPKDANPPSCKKACTDKACKALGVPSAQVECVAGRCVKAFDCDSSKVTCKLAPPKCPAGSTPQVAGNCYTLACVQSSQCKTVPDCSACGPNEACSTYVTQLGPQPHCVSVPPECKGDATCGCLGPTTCIKPFNSCNDLSGIKGVSCGCPVC